MTRKSLLLLLAILALAAGLRLWGVDYGLPHIYHTDESFEVQRALKLGVGVFDFERIGKGGYYYLLFVLFGAYYALLSVGGSVSGGEEFLLRFFTDPTPIWLIGRTCTAVIGTFNCYLIYRLGVHYRSSVAGLVAAGFMAVHLLHVESSHYITVDVPLTTLLTACFLVMYGVGAGQAQLRHYLLLGLLAAAAVATKISGAPILLAVLLFHANQLGDSGRSRWLSFLVDRRLAGFGLTFSIVYMALEPGIFFHVPRYAGWLATFFQSSTERVQPGNFPVLPDRADAVVQFYASAMFPLRYLAVLLLFAGGLLLGLKRYPLKRQYGLVFFIPYLFFILSSRRPDLIYDRYLLPLTPVIWILAGLFVHEAQEWLARRWRPAVLFVGLVVALGFVPMLADSVRDDLERTRTDTRTLTKDWIEANVPAGSVIYLSGSIVKASALTAPLNIEPDLVDSILERRISADEKPGGHPKSRFYEIYKQALRRKTTYHLVLSDNKPELAEALEQGIGDYVVLIEGVRSLYEIERNRLDFPHRYRLIRWVDSGAWEEVRRFAPDETTVGPTLVIYARTDRASKDES